MSEVPSIDVRVLLGRTEYTNPLRNPDTGQIDSMFDATTPEVRADAGSGSAFGPTRLLEEVFRPNFPRGYYEPEDIPENVDEIRVLRGSIDSFRQHASARASTRLGIYNHALGKKEQELDPPIHSFIANFVEDADEVLDDPSEFQDMAVSVFGIHGEKMHPAKADYVRLGNSFMSDPKTLAAFNLLRWNAEASGLIRPNWESGRDGKPFYSVVKEGIHAKISTTSTSYASVWLADAINAFETVFSYFDEKISSDGYEHRTNIARRDSYASLCDISRELPLSVEDGMGYDVVRNPYYRTISDLLIAAHNSVDKPNKAAFEKFRVDVCRDVIIRAYEERLLLINNRNARVFSPATKQLIRWASQPKDGYISTAQHFLDYVMPKVVPEQPVKKTQDTLSNILNSKGSGFVRKFTAE